MKLHFNYSEISQNFQRFKAAAPQAIRKAANSANLAYQLDLLISKIIMATFMVWP